MPLKRPAIVAASFVPVKDFLTIDDDEMPGDEQGVGTAVRRARNVPAWSPSNIKNIGAADRSIIAAVTIHGPHPMTRS